jgi:hypothetical protein
MTNTIAIRTKVAEFCGFIDICREVGFLGEVWKGCKKDGLYVIFPHYDLSLDAITQAFDEHGLTYTLHKGIADNGDVGYFASNPKGEKYSDTAAKAMCYLFIHCMES